MDHTNQDRSEKIDGIKCEVTNCVYHRKDNCCEAGCIEVGPGYANSTDETICATFEAKQ